MGFGGIDTAGRWHTIRRYTTLEFSKHTSCMEDTEWVRYLLGMSPKFPSNLCLHCPCPHSHVGTFLLEGDDLRDFGTLTELPGTEEVPKKGTGHKRGS